MMAISLLALVVQRRKAEVVYTIPACGIAAYHVEVVAWLRWVLRIDIQHETLENVERGEPSHASSIKAEEPEGLLRHLRDYLRSIRWIFRPSHIAVSD